jgi:hypothetical protein
MGWVLANKKSRCLAAAAKVWGEENINGRTSPVDGPI